MLNPEFQFTGKPMQELGDSVAYGYWYNQELIMRWRGREVRKPAGIFYAPTVARANLAAITSAMAECGEQV